MVRATRLYLKRKMDLTLDIPLPSVLGASIITFSGEPWGEQPARGVHKLLRELPGRVLKDFEKKSARCPKSGILVFHLASSGAK